MIRTSLPVKKSLKPRKCKSCGVSFVPVRSLQAACSVPCALAIAAKQKAQKAARAAKDERKSIRVALEKAKTRGTHLKELQAAFNAFIRARDANDPCISCDRPATWDGQWHASHYRSVGSTPELRFNEFNVHRSCSICNNFLSGNIGSYRPRLIAKIGLEKVEWLEGEHAPLKLTIAEIQELKIHYRAEVRRMKKATQPEMEIA
ncbi:recombination protein NinG [Paraburkholderia tropica]|uniref:recombination protein NinG n=1 Tax=Paraburkholderia tropica TaxID=92647 RepID=UPI000B1A5463|nr:recombination protein NinG [Paraburkholderia tropica]